VISVVVIIFLEKSIKKYQMHGLIVVILGILIMKYLAKSFSDVSIVKEIPSGFTCFVFLILILDQIRIVPIALTFSNGWLFETISMGSL
jgi:hypothetical protein